MADPVRIRSTETADGQTKSQDDSCSIVRGFGPDSREIQGAIDDHFWTVTDPMARQMQMVNFMKNLAMLGGALMISYFGAGPMSIDSLLDRRRSLSRSEEPHALEKQTRKVA